MIDRERERERENLEGGGGVRKKGRNGEWGGGGNLVGCCEGLKSLLLSQ